MPKTAHHWKKEKSVNDAMLDDVRPTRLTPSSVIDIRNRYACGEYPSNIALLHGVSKGTVRDVVKGRTWKHVIQPAGLPAPLLRKSPLDLILGCLRSLYSR